MEATESDEGIIEQEEPEPPEDPEGVPDEPESSPGGESGDEPEGLPDEDDSETAPGDPAPGETEAPTG
jgi:hypothetical protein